MFHFSDKILSSTEHNSLDIFLLIPTNVYLSSKSGLEIFKILIFAAFGEDRTDVGVEFLTDFTVQSADILIAGKILRTDFKIVIISTSTAHFSGYVLIILKQNSPNGSIGNRGKIYILTFKNHFAPPNSMLWNTFASINQPNVLCQIVPTLFVVPISLCFNLIKRSVILCWN